MKVNTSSKKKKLKSIPQGVAHIHSTYNNTIVTIAEPNGSVICWKSCGGSGFKGTKKGTPFAAQIAAESAATEAMKHGIKKLDVKLKGLGSGREAAVRSLHAAGITLLSIQDVTPIPHNGPRPKKARRT